MMVQDWELSKLGDIIKYKKGLKPRVLLEESRKNTVPYLTADFFRNKKAKLFTPHSGDNRFVEASDTDVILIWDGSNAGDVFMGLNGALASTMVKFLPNDKIDNKFLHFFLKTKFNLLNEKTTGSTIPHVSKYVLNNLLIPLPPKSEQNAIIHILSKIQSAIETQEKIIKTTTELKKALMQKLFTEGLHGEKQKETEIGRAPKGWKIVPLEQTGEVVYGIQAAVANLTKPIGTKILTNINITFDGDIDLTQLRYYPLTKPRHFKTILKKGDILFNWRSGSKDHVGKTAFFDLDGEFTHSSFILRIRTKQGVLNKYLFYYLTYLRSSGYFQKLQNYSVNAKFNASAVNALPTALPDYKEQMEIANAMTKIDQKIKKEADKLQLVKSLFNSMLHHLMTGQIRVKDLRFS